MDNKTVPDYSTDSIEPKWLIYIKGIIRPLATILILYLYYIVMTNPEKYAKFNAIDSITEMTLIVIAFWFGERLLRNTGITTFLQTYNKTNKS